MAHDEVKRLPQRLEYIPGPTYPHVDHTTDELLENSGRRFPLPRIAGVTDLQNLLHGLVRSRSSNGRSGEVRLHPTGTFSWRAYDITAGIVGVTIV